jgi:hypothetical protein
LPMALVILSKNWLSPPTISIFADFMASPSTPAWAAAMSFWMLIWASSTALVLLEVELELLVLATGVFEQLHGLGLLGDAIGFRGEFELRDFGIDWPCFCEASALARAPGLRQGPIAAERGGFGFGEGFRGGGIFGGRFLPGFGEREQFLGVQFGGLLGGFGGLGLGKGGLFGGELRGLFGGLGFFDFLDELLLRVFSALVRATCFSRSAVAKASVSFIFCCSTTTVFSSATRSLMTSWMFLRSTSTASPSRWISAW